MGCLIPMHVPGGVYSSERYLNVDSIVTVLFQHVSNGWDIIYTGSPGSSHNLADETYPTRSEAEARIKYIEKMVNTKCGTNLKITLPKQGETK